MSYLLDASAVLATLFDEPGGDFVFGLMNESHISVVNLSEVYATLMDGGLTFDAARDVVAPLPFRIRTFREEHAWQTAQLRPLTKRFGLSLGDRACIAHAMMTGLPILTSDRRMAEARDVLGIDIRLIR
jgi:ribonuclease VapC